MSNPSERLAAYRATIEANRVTREALRKRLFAAGRHLNAHRFGWVANRFGLGDFAGASKGIAVDCFVTYLTGKSVYDVHLDPAREARVVEALRNQEAAQPRYR